MSEPVVLLYDNTSFTGTERKIPLYVFDNLYPGVTTIKSARIPKGAYFTVFTNGTGENMIAGQSKTYTSDVSDITTFSNKITGYMIQTSTIPFNWHGKKYIPCTLHTDFMWTGSNIVQLNDGDTSSQKINNAISMTIGTNNVTLTDDNGQSFIFYNNVAYLPAYLTNITNISVVSVPIDAPLPSATVIASATTATATTTPPTVSPPIPIDAPLPSATVISSATTATATATTTPPNPNTPTPTPTPSSSDKSSSNQNTTIVLFLYKHMFTIIILMFVAAMIYYGLNYTKIYSTVDSKVNTSTTK